MTYRCDNCEDTGWVCECHPQHPWPKCKCGGAGMWCPECRPTTEWDWSAANQLREFALEWEADIKFNTMSDGSEPGPAVKICPREQCSRETLERRIAFIRNVADQLDILQQSQTGD